MLGYNLSLDILARNGNTVVHTWIQTISVVLFIVISLIGIIENYIAPRFVDGRSPEWTYLVFLISPAIPISFLAHWIVVPSEVVGPYVLGTLMAGLSWSALLLNAGWYLHNDTLGLLIVVANAVLWTAFSICAATNAGSRKDV